MTEQPPEVLIDVPDEAPSYSDSYDWQQCGSDPSQQVPHKNGGTE